MLPKQQANFGTTIEQRLTPSSERARALVDSVLQSMRVALPAVVQSFSAGPPATVSVLVAANEYLFQNSAVGSISLETESGQLPELQDVPVQFYSAGGWSLTMPIQAGDECLLVFCDTPIDIWLQNGGLDNQPFDQRRHNLSDAVAIFGLRSKPRGLSGYSTSSAQLRSDDGTVVIDLAAGQVTITAPVVTVNSSDTVNVTATNRVNIQASGQTFLEGKNFLLHKHTGVASGTSNSGPVL